MDSGTTTITSWEQAFENYRIPETRILEKELRSSATRDKEKLRTLVGGSYRDLLATAESIVVLDGKTRAAEEHLSLISHSCRPPTQDLSTRSPSNENVLLAQFRLLQRSITTSGTILRQHKILQCAQLLVVSRLLVKSLGDHELAIKPLGFLRNKVATLRRQLLRQVDATLTSPKSQIPDLLEALCSYCLVTSVSSAEALTHLFQLRLEKLRRHLSSPSALGNSVVCDALRYQVVSLQTFKSLIGRPLTDAISNIQKRPILAEPSLRDIESLDLDRLLSLISPDIQTFVPYFKRTVPSPEETRSKLENWSKDASTALGSALESLLADIHDPNRILQLRKDLYTVLLPTYFSTPAGPELHAHISKSLNGRLDNLVQSQVSQLNDIIRKLIDVNNAGPSTAVKSLWDADLARQGVSISGAKYARQVKDSHNGYHESLTKASRALKKWIASVNAMQVSFSDVSKVRWRDLLEEPDEDDEDEATNIIRTLVQTYPDHYKQTLQDSLQSALTSYETSIVNVASTFTLPSSSQSPAPDSSSIPAASFLRSIRMTSSALQAAFPSQTAFPRIIDVVNLLHETLAKETIRRLSELTQQDQQLLPHISTDIANLPDNMPSPKTFLALQRICDIMFEIGGADLWSRPAVTRVKDLAAKWIFGEGDIRRSFYVETEFDEAYLRQALATAPKGDVGEDNLVQLSREVALQRKAATEYWGRTKLLFGILA